MKKKILGVAIVAAIALVSGWNISQSKSDVALSDMALAKVEALAQAEITCSSPNPYGGQCYVAQGCGSGSWCGCYFSGYQSDFCYYG
jgi:hypothetical protein